MKNPIFRSLEDKWRGPLPCTARELVIALVTGALTTVLSHVFFGVIITLVILATLVAWRKRDHDRSDYVECFGRRRLSRIRVYNSNEPES